MALCRAWSNPSGGWRSRGRFTHPWWGKQSTWLAASGCPEPLRAWPAPALYRRRRRAQARGGQAGESRRRGRVGPVCRFQGEGGGSAPVGDTWTALGRVWGGGCPGHPNPEKERLREAPFRALWGRSILVLG